MGRNFHFLAAGKLVSDLGTWLDMVALNTFIYQVTGSAVYTGLFMAARLFGAFLTSFYAGVLCDRIDRKTLMITADLVRCAAVLSLVLAPSPTPLGLFFVVAFLLGCFGALFEVSLQSSVPAIVGNENRVKANAILGACQSVGMVIGCSMGATLLGALGYKAAFGFDALSYLASAGNLFLLPLRTIETKTAAPAKRPFFEEVASIVSYFRGIPVLMGMLVIRLADSLGSASHNVGIPVFAAKLDPARPSYYVGVFYATWAVGKLLCSYVAARPGGIVSRKLKETGSSERAFGLATIAMSLSFICLFWSTGFAAIALLSILAGIADGLSEIAYQSRLQEVPDEIRGRAFGVAGTMQTVGFGVGMIACSPLFDRMPPGGVVTLLHGIPMSLSLAFTWFVYSVAKEKRMKLETLAIALTLAALTGAAPARAEDTISLAHVNSLTGAEATYGTSADNGAHLAIEEINAKGGIKGKKLVLLSLDDASKSSEAVTAITKAITKDKVIAVLGEITSSRTLAMGPIAQAAGIPLVSPAATNTKVTQIGDNVFRVCFLDSFQAKVMAKFAIQKLRLKKLAIFRDVKSDYSVGMANLFAESIRKLGGEIVTDVSYSGGDIDFKSQLVQIRKRKPDAIFVPGYYNEVAMIARQARELNLSQPFLGGDGFDSPKLIELGGRAVEGSYFINHYFPDDPSPVVKRFLAAYKKKYGTVPDASAGLGYDAAMVVASAIGRATALTPKAVRDAIAATKGYEGVTGTITIDRDRNAQKGGVIVSIQGGKFNFHSREAME